MPEINSLNDFIKFMPSNLNSIILKARYLYLELGKRSFYDPQYKYFMFGEEEEDLTYKSKIYQNPNIIICTTLAKQYSELLTKAGIQNQVACESNEAHHYVEFYDEQGNIHIADITNDLKNIQFNCRTEYFGKTTIPFEELKQYDLDLGYISQSRGYSNDYWYIVRDILQNSQLSDKKKLEIVLENLQKFGDLSKMR